jgi:uncharacterized membrane protein YebE (DUF533 family)
VNYSLRDSSGFIPTPTYQRITRMDAVKLLGSLMNNKSLSSGLGSQLLGGLLGGNPQQQSSSSGLAGLLGGVLGGSGNKSGGSQLGGLLDLLGGGQGAGGGIGGMLGSVLGGDKPAAQQATATQQQHSHSDANDQAIMMIRAMVNAAKSDGRIDQKEQENIISKLGADVSEAEVEFLKEEFAAPLDVERFARSVPNGLEQQVYGISLTSIELDTQNEAQYLGNLAKGLNLDPKICNQIHEHLGAPKIFG